MTDQPIVRFVSQREGHHGDCTIAAFGMCFGLTYAEALVCIARVAPHVLTQGASWGTLVRVAKDRGTPLLEKRIFDLDDYEEGSGILGVRFTDGGEHAVYFHRGFIFDGRTGCVWDADVYLRVSNVTPLTMLVRT